MSKIERVGALFFSLLAFVLIGFKLYDLYLLMTVSIPTSGGVYEEAVYGDLKYINPITAQSETDRSVSKLLFSGLVKVASQDKILPDLAEKWETSTDGQTYTFYLKKNLTFSDGAALTANDVAYTVDYIKDPASKSPLLNSWSNVTVQVVDDYTVTFSLPKVYGPFIYNCAFGILPSHLSSDEFSKKLSGSGPYKFLKSSKTKDSTKISSIELVKNTNYAGSTPYIDKLKLDFYASKDEAKSAYENGKKVNGLFGTTSGVGQDKSFQSGRRLGLIANVTSEKLKDVAVRQKLFEATAKFDTAVDLNLATLDASYQRAKADELVAKYKELNVNLNVQYLTPLQFPDAISARKYDLLLYGFDFGYDRDPYTFWHSSQVASGMNFAGWSDKASDILLEDARMIIDPVQRNAKYDEFFANVFTKQFLGQFYDPISYNFAVKDSIRNVGSIAGNQVYSRYSDISSWHIEEKRVRK
ncbi:MAG: ABC transporter substrate-binding protein [Patescibacteria group bacterium]|jgi:ABC-type transport system substrate-binding protein